MNILIVHAHHEPNSFSSALKDRAVATLTKLGHHVEVSDLYAMGFNPVSDRRNFTMVANPAYLKQQREETYAAEHDGFAPELVAEMEKVLHADLLIFNFPLWWFGMPAALKGWVDRVFAYGKMYGAGKLYENGVGRGKRALVTMTTGSASGAYTGYGYHPPMATILTPIHHGIFWFNGFAPLPPFVAYSVAHVGDDERARLLDDYERYLSALDDQRPIVLPPMRDFAGDAIADRFGRWMVEARNARELDETCIAELQRDGKILAFWSSRDGDPEPIAWFVFRAEFRESAEAITQMLNCGDAAEFVIRELARPGTAELAAPSRVLR